MNEEGQSLAPGEVGVDRLILHSFDKLRTGPASFIVCFALGAATVLGFSPFNLFPLPVLTLVALFWLCRVAATPRRAALAGFGFGLGLFCVGLAWLYISLHDFGGMPAPIAVLAVVLLCACMALYPAAAGWLATRLGATPLRFAVAAAAGWTIMEWLRSWVFTGFPWLNIGYSQVPWSPLAGFAPIGGVFAVSFAVALIAALIAVLPSLKKSSPRGAIAVVSLLAVALLAAWALKGIAFTAPAGAPVSVSLLQGNIPQEIKFVPGRIEQQLQTYLDLAAASKSRLIIMPESSIPLLKSQAPPEYLDLLRQRATALGGDMLVGVFDDADEGREIYNSVMSVGVSPTQVYRKVHLVPFGEFIPLKWLVGWVYDTMLNIPLSDQTPGARFQEPLKVAGERVAVDICYEDAFGEEVIRQLPEATLLVNVSNDAWFGERIAPWQHTQIAQMRALETGRYMLRATNTGVTSIIDESGRLVSHLPQLKTDALNGTAQGRTGATPFVLAGNGPIVGLCIVVLAALWLAKRRSPDSPFGDKSRDAT